jgi:hypothetical protein
MFDPLCFDKLNKQKLKSQRRVNWNEICTCMNTYIDKLNKKSAKSTRIKLMSRSENRWLNKKSEIDVNTM